jgi:hypothetical protein
MDDVLLIAGCGNPVLADYATHCLGRGGKVSVVSTPQVCGKIAGQAEWLPAEKFSHAAYLAAHPGRRLSGAVLFLDGALTAPDRTVLAEAAALARAGGAGCVCIVSTFRVHLGDAAAARAEAFVRARLRGFAGRVVILRPAHVLSRHSRLGAFLRRSWFWFPLVPGKLKGCCIEGDELFAVIDRELDGPQGRKSRTYTLLGANRPWQDRLREQGKGPLAHAYAALARVFFPLAVLRILAGLLLDLAGRRVPPLRPWHVETLRPGSLKELLTLYNKYNYRHVKVVGYNNGVVHFGQKFPGKTVISTAACKHLARVKGAVGEFDAGVTVRQAMDVLGPQGRELYVLPNYSYVSLGTSLFIPIHGSASAFGTIADTIDKVLLYDAARDRCVVAARGDPAFGNYVYNLGAAVLLLRLHVQTREKCRYYVKQVELASPSSREVLGYFHDKGPSNVELRKAGSAARTVTVCRYYTEGAAGIDEALEVPRDALGRVWDRLEENPITRILFHGLVRSLAYHVELFLSEQDFATFWETHGGLPILKIQLRFIPIDGYPHSPFREHDCVAADLFLRRKHKGLFDAYLKEKLPGVRLNPGKHSM